MNASTVAQNILGDMWEYGRLILIAGVVGLAWGSLLKRTEAPNEQNHFQVRLVLIVLGMVGPFVLFSFLNVEAGNIITLIYVKPAWGIFTCLVALSLFLFAAIAGYKLLVASRREPPLSIKGTTGEPRHLFTRDVKLILSVLSLLTAASIFWLWRLAQ